SRPSSPIRRKVAASGGLRILSPTTGGRPPGRNSLAVTGSRSFPWSRCQSHATRGVTRYPSSAALAAGSSSSASGRVPYSRLRVHQASTAPGIVTACGVGTSICVILRSRNHSSLAFPGARPEPFSATGNAPPFEYMTKQSPPMPVLCGSTTHCTATAAIAASTALPPARSTSSAVRVARGAEVAAMPFDATIADRPGILKSRIIQSSALAQIARRGSNPGRRASCLPSTNAPSYPSGQFAKREEELIMDGSLTTPLHLPVAMPPGNGETITIAPGVEWLRMPLPFALDHINLWLLEDGPGWAIVDAGYATAETTARWERIFAERLRGLPVTRIIATHHHPDHIGLAGWLAERWQAPLWISEKEWLFARLMTGSADDSRGLRRDFARRAGFDEAASELFAKHHQGYRRGVPSVPSSFRRLADGLVVEIGGREWRVIIGEGHSPELACLYCAETGVLISGDQVL